MKIVFYSPNFHPLIGGLENVVYDLAYELSVAGHQVRVITKTPNNKPDTYVFDVVRTYTFLNIVNLIKWGDILVQTNVSLKGIIPAFLANRPIFVNHQNEYPSTLNGAVKRFIANQFTVNVSCSSFIAKTYKTCEVIANPYNNTTFHLNDAVNRQKDIVFLGRLVSVKGANILLDSLAILSGNYELQPTVTMVGSGPEKDNLMHLATKLGVDSQVVWTDTVVGDELAHLLNEHQVMVVPSVYDEPFGIVALEGIACGCLVIGSDGGGLPEAIGPCGLTFPSKKPEALAGLLAQALTDPSIRLRCQQVADAHLKKHHRQEVAKRFLAVLKTNGYE